MSDKENYNGEGLTDRENYFPPGTSLDEINDTLYTDNCFLSSPNDLGDDLIQEAYKYIEEEENDLEPPF